MLINIKMLKSLCEIRELAECTCLYLLISQKRCIGDFLLAWKCSVGYRYLPLVIPYTSNFRYFSNDGCNAEALVAEAEYFGLEALTKGVCLFSNDTLWFNVVGKRFALKSAVLDQELSTDCLLRRKNLHSSSHPRDEYGAYVFDRDPELFAAIHDYILTGRYPSWIHHRLDNN